MFTRLAFRNVKRQIGNYAIYFVTLALNIALLFAINMMIYSDQIQQFAEATSDIESMFRIITIMVSVITALVLSYATSFMMKLRRKEFGMYMTLGMNKWDIMKLFVLENIAIFMLALVFGMVIGILAFQGIMALFAVILKMAFKISAYTIEGILMTVLISAIMFVVANLTSILYIRRASIFELLHVKKAEKSEKHLWIWGISTVGSSIFLVICFYQIWVGIQYIGSEEALMILQWFAGFLGGIFCFHLSTSRFLAGVLLKNKKFKNKGTNVVILRSLSEKMRVNGLLIGAIAVLFVSAIVAAHIGISEKDYSNEELKKCCPFDLRAEYEIDDEQPLSLKNAEKIIGKYSKIADEFSLKMYSDRNKNVVGQCYGCEEMGWVDLFLPLSSYNKIMKKQGRKPLKLEKQFRVISIIGGLEEVDFSKVTLNFNDKAYSYEGIDANADEYFDHYIYIVIPDEALENMPLYCESKFYTLETKQYDAMKMIDQLTTKKPESVYEQCNFTSKEYYRLVRDAEAGALIISMLYVATIFICMAFAILALKVISTVEEEQKRYNILKQIGADRELQNRTLFRQIQCFFATPFIIPFLMNIPVTIAFKTVRTKWGFVGVTGNEAVYIGLVIGICFLIVYLLYFVLTYQISKKQVVS